jgi:hypothetical protein
MEFEIEGRCVVTLDYSESDATSTHVSTDFNLDISKNVERKNFFDKEDLLTADGSKALSQCFIQGLIGNIHYAHQKGIWDSAEHMRYIISELERGFVIQANVSQSYFKEK